MIIPISFDSPWVTLHSLPLSLPFYGLWASGWPCFSYAAAIVAADGDLTPILALVMLSHLSSLLYSPLAPCKFVMHPVDVSYICCS